MVALCEFPAARAAVSVRRLLLLMCTVEQPLREKSVSLVFDRKKVLSCQNKRVSPVKYGQAHSTVVPSARSTL